MDDSVNSGTTFESEFEYGYGGSGIHQLLSEVKGIVLTQAGEAAKGEPLEAIIKVCENNWAGNARIKYVENLKADAEKFCDALNTLYNAFDAEIQNAGYNYSFFDNHLMDEEV